jgi:hypothetical protein
MKIQCRNCGVINTIEGIPKSPRKCIKCGMPLPSPQPSGDMSQAVGLIGGAALGAAIGGPVGAIIGGIVGAYLGKEGKGVG